MTTILEQGVEIAGRYRLEERIGEGGMGSVWRARHLALDAPVAIKFVRYEGDNGERLGARFEREARIAAAVRHRNVVSITDYGHTDDGTVFMAMDYLEGVSMADYIVGAPSPSEVFELMLHAVRGLCAVHDAGIVHRDLKPENIFLVRDASGLYPKLIDFGISKQLNPERGPRSAVTTREGAVLGTPEYMSPEQARGVTHLDQRTDIYSVGTILYEALCGRLPYEAEYVGDLMMAIVFGGARPLHERNPALPRAVSDLVMKAMANKPEQRYQTARELLRAMEAARPLLRVLNAPGEPASDDAREPVTAPGRDEARPSTLDSHEFPLTAPPSGLSPGGGRKAWTLVLLSGVVVGSFWLWSSWDGAPPKAGSALPPVAVSASAPVTPEPVSDNEAETPPNPQLQVALEGVPAGAEVRLDGVAMQGARFELPRDEREHVVEVFAPGHQAWSTRFLADEDLAAVVELAPLARPEPEASRATPARHRQSGARGRPSRPTRVVTELDY